MRKTLVLINDFYSGGGAEIVMQDHANLLKKAGWKINLITGIKNIKIFNNNKLLVLVLNLYYMLFGYLIILYKLLKLKPAVIHLYNWYHILTPQIFISLTIYKKLYPKTKIFYSAHDFHLLIAAFPPKEKNIFYKIIRGSQGLIYYRLLRLPCIFDKNFAPSKTVAKIVDTFYKKIRCTKPKTIILYNPLPKELETQLLKHQKTWSSKNEPNQIKLVFVGRVTPDKGVLSLVKLLNKVKRKDSSLNFSLTIVGDGNELPKIKQIASKLAYHIKCLGRKPLLQVPSILKKHHALIMHSKPFVENAPLVMREASIANLYMIVPDDHGGMSEYGKILKGTFFYKRNNVTSLRKALQRAQNQITAYKVPRSSKKLQEIRTMFAPSTFTSMLLKYYNL